MDFTMTDDKSRTEYHREYAKKRRSTEEGKEENRGYAKKWREENKEAYNAYKRDQMRRIRAQAKALKENENQPKD
jgi:hypothetical protein